MKNILLLCAMFICGFQALAQVPSPSQIQQMKVDDLTDEQVRQIVEEMRKNRVALNQIDGFAQQKGIPSTEVAKLKERIRSLNLEKELTYGQQNNTAEQVNADRQINDGTVISARDIQPMTEGERRRSKIFGYELFSNKNLTFEPNLRLPTPPNYRLAAGDEIVVDVYGYSEVQHTMKVSPEGYVRIPYVGPVYVNGLTMEETRVRITKQLSTIYGGIKAGNTYVQVSLGNIRSISVLLIGEVVRPGTYTLPSLATVANALYVSGGPDENGSFRNIQVIRNGQPLITFDLYDFLRSGNLTNNIVLQDQDIVKVNAYKNRIEIAGEVKRPAIYEVANGETLQTIIDLAGGYTDIAFKDIIRAYRINFKEREVVNIPANEIATFSPKSGDKYFIDAVLNRFSNRVMITGSVFHPGEYAMEANMSLLDLIRKADGVREEALQDRGIIFRRQHDQSPSGQSFNLKNILNGSEKITLRMEDSVVIYSKLDLREPLQIKISGEVNNPGYFKFADSLQIEDLILVAGGLKDAASLKRIEIARRIRGKEYSPSDSSVTIVAQFDVNSDLSPTRSFILEPFDEIVVRRSPSYLEQSNIVINGEVVYPGSYSIQSRHERISDLIKRAGGLKPEAYADGAVLLRKTFYTESDSALLHSKLDIYYNKLLDSSNITKIQADTRQKMQLVGINLTDILRHPNSKYDLYLEEGDEINIPKIKQTIQLYGEVYFPKKVRYDKGNTFREYVRGAGGFTNNALKRRSYVVYANGEVKGARKIFFFTSFPKLKPGAEVYVPKKGEKKGLNPQEFLGIGTGIASLALIIATILNK